MKITRFVRIQLLIFAIVTVVALVAMAIFYIRIPSMFGIGEYRVELKLPSSGGLYQNANVSFRGVNVGKVTAVKLTENGVVADLSIDSGTDIPVSSQAAVRSVSAIGEQYVEFTPVPNGPSGHLYDGSVVDSGQVPVEISTMLDQANALLNKVGDTKLRSVMDEAFEAFNGTGEQLQRLLDSMTLLVGDASKNTEPLMKLIDQSGPLLSTQSQTSDEIRSWTADVTKFTDQLRANNPQVTDILQKGPSTASQTQELFSSMDQTLPMLIANLGVSAKTLAVYHPNLQQIVVIYPRLMAALITALNTENGHYGANVDFALGFQDPGTCTMGFLPASQWRSPAIQTPRDIPPGMLCRVPQDSNLAVRGARNFPCAEFPGRRAPTPEECRTGYKPKGENVAFPEGLPFGLKPPANASAKSPAKAPAKVPTGQATQATPSSYTPGAAVYATPYDPKTGDYIGPDGKTYNAGLGQDSQGQDSTWESMISNTVQK
ncbi:MCE family protein [Gordonia sp. DT101]|uniref:MCE family protein n=1 Tax=Gordonia sp. DT101 TaxID=3416545 RepID=UPI003CF8C904